MPHCCKKPKEESSWVTEATSLKGKNVQVCLCMFPHCRFPPAVTWRHCCCWHRSMTTQWVERGSLGESAHTLISTAFEHGCQVVAPANERYGSYEDAIFVAGQFITAMRLYEQDWQSRMTWNPSLLNFSGEISDICWRLQDFKIMQKSKNLNKSYYANLHCPCSVIFFFPYHWTKEERNARWCRQKCTRRLWDSAELCLGGATEGEGFTNNWRGFNTKRWREEKKRKTCSSFMASAAIWGVERTIIPCHWLV